MGVIEQVSQWLAPWQSLYNDSKVVSSSVTATHVLAMLWSGGLAVAADRSTLRAAGRGPAIEGHQLAELGATHRPVLAALTVVVLSGLLLLAADLTTFVGSVVFWIKMGLITVLLANGMRLTRIEAALRRGAPLDQAERLWARLQSSSRLSIVLWSLTLVVGVILVDAA